MTNYYQQLKRRAALDVHKYTVFTHRGTTSITAFTDHEARNTVINYDGTAWVRLKTGRMFAARTRKDGSRQAIECAQDDAALKEFTF